MTQTLWQESGAPADAAVRALITGEGLKETFLATSDLPLGWRWHRDRMARGAAQMGLPWPGERRLEAAVRAALRGHERTAGPLGSGHALRVRLLLLAAGSNLDLGQIEASRLSVSVTTVALEALKQAPARLALGPRLRDAEHPLAGCKTTAIAADLVALRTARAAGFDDVLLLDVQGRLSEASTSNIVMGLADGRVLTPSAACGPVAGTVVARLLAHSSESSRRLERCELLEGDLASVRWAVLVNAVRGARPVASVGAAPLRPPPDVWCCAIQRCVCTVEPGAMLDPEPGGLRQ